MHLLLLPLVAAELQGRRAGGWRKTMGMFVDEQLDLSKEVGAVTE